MSRITIELLRKSAEHNEGCLQTLEEVLLQDLSTPLLDYPSLERFD